MVDVANEVSILLGSFDRDSDSKSEKRPLRRHPTESTFTSLDLSLHEVEEEGLSESSYDTSPQASPSADGDAQDSQHQKSKRRVSFSSVFVRDYGMVLGDHPGCSYGLPVQLGWDYFEYEPLDIDKFEVNRDKRTLRQMMLNYHARKRLLEIAGETAEDLKRAKKELSRTKLNRSVTLHLAPSTPLQAALESAGRKFKRLLRDDHWKQEKALYTKRQ